MSIVTTFPFDNPSNYTLVNAAVGLGTGKLSLVDLAALQFTEDFADDTGFTYDNTKTEFTSGLMRQKDLRPANATFHANYSANINGTWGNGVLTGTATGSAAILSGKLDLSFDDLRFVTYAALNNASFVQTGTIEFKVTPNYSGSPTTEQYFVTVYTPSTNNNTYFIQHSAAGTLIILGYSSSGALVLVATLGAWVPTAGVEYEFSANFDFTAGAHRLFIDGVQLGATNTSTGTRSSAATKIAVGTNQAEVKTANFKIDDVLIFDTVQHTANYTAGQSRPATAFATDTVDLPDFAYSGLGVIQSLQSLAITEVGTPQYTLEGMYWNGSSWVASDGSYAQSNTLADTNTNIAALGVAGQSEISMQVVWKDDATQSSVDTAALTYTGQQYAAEGSLLTNSSFVAKEITSFIPVEIKPANTDIKYIMNINGVDRYHDGASWVVSDGTNSQANTLAEVQANLSTLLPENDSVKIKTVLTGDQLVTPEIDLITVVYDFGALEPAAPTQCQVFGFLKDSEDQPIVGAVVTIRPNRLNSFYVEAANRVITSEQNFTTDSEGFFSFNLIISSEFESLDNPDFEYVLDINISGQDKDIDELEKNEPIVFKVPNLPSANITDLITAV